MSILPMKCRRYLVKRGVPFEEHEEGDQKAVILKAFALPTGRFDAPSADLLILLPSRLSRRSARYVLRDPMVEASLIQ